MRASSSSSLYRRFYVVCQNGHIEIVKLLLKDERIEINWKNNNGQTPFFIAFWNGHIDIVKLLLNDERVDVNKANTNGDTFLYCM